jgi:hypothetical protein
VDADPLVQHLHGRHRDLWPRLLRRNGSLHRLRWGYSDLGIIACDFYAHEYDRWVFTSAADGYAYVSVDTVDSSSTFGPQIMVLDDASCQLGIATNDFDCTWPSSKTMCPSYKLPVTKGAAYYVLVQSRGDCAGSGAEYEIRIAAEGDPGLTLDVDDSTIWTDVQVVSIGTATIVP